VTLFGRPDRARCAYARERPLARDRAFRAPPATLVCDCQVTLPLALTRTVHAGSAGPSKVSAKTSVLAARAGGTPPSASSAGRAAAINATATTTRASFDNSIISAPVDAWRASTDTVGVRKCSFRPPRGDGRSARDRLAMTLVGQRNRRELTFIARMPYGRPETAQAQ